MLFLLFNVCANQPHLPKIMWKPITHWLAQDEPKETLNHDVIFFGASVCLNNRL